MVRDARAELQVDAAGPVQEDPQRRRAPGAASARPPAPRRQARRCDRRSSIAVLQRGVRRRREARGWSSGSSIVKSLRTCHVVKKVGWRPTRRCGRSRRSPGGRERPSIAARHTAVPAAATRLTRRLLRPPAAASPGPRWQLDATSGRRTAPSRPAPRAPRALAEHSYSRSAAAGSAASVKLGPQPPPGIAVERELTDAQRAAPADVEQRAVHAAARAVEHAQPGDLVGEPSASASPSRAPTPEQHQEPGPISPTTSPSTDTDAELTRWIRARTPTADCRLPTYAAFNRSR